MGGDGCEGASVAECADPAPDDRIDVALVVVTLAWRLDDVRCANTTARAPADREGVVSGGTKGITSMLRSSTGAVAIG